VATFPPQAELNRLPGRVVIFYDRNDKPTPSGIIPGDEGAKKVAHALGDRAWVAQVPRPPECAHIHGWDVSDAINAGYKVEDFYIPPVVAYQLKRETDKIVENPLRARFITNDELLARAPDYTEWLVDDLLTCNELYPIRWYDLSM